MLTKFVATGDIRDISTYMNSTSPPRRAYRLGARAKAAEAAADRTLAAFRTRLRDSWFDEIRLEDVAADAGVSVPTVIRRFGGKEGLLEAAYQQVGHEVLARRAVPPGDTAAAVRGLIDDYEASGDLILRSLAQEDRHPAIRHATDIGRAGHRDWLAEVFAGALADLPQAAARQRLDALVVATDVYVWKLVRRDMRRPPSELKALMEHLIEAALVTPSAARGRSPK
jgi:AcrR family transcriptional regulator